MQLPDTVTVLEKEGRTFYIIGTAHVSEESVREVSEIIEQVRPDTVCVELCEARYKAITDENRWKNLDIFKVIREGKTLFLMANLALGAYQRRIGQKLGVKPGAEMVAGIKKAEEVGAHIELVDRDIHVTLKRTWANVGFWRKITLLGAILEGLVGGEEIEAEDIEKLKEKSQLSEVMAEFARVLPEVKRPLIDERDEFMMSCIEEAPGNTVVAIVGAGHMEGMVSHFNTPIDREPLKVIPQKSIWMRMLKWLIPVAVLVGFWLGWDKTRDFATVEDMIQQWVIPNSVFAALLTMIGGGKLVSVVTAFIVSPFTSLNPALPAGLVVGLVEAWFRRPTVADAERINEEVTSISGVYRNPFTRVLLVAVMATFGSALGAWVGLSWLFAGLAS
ncbi:MAG TPA: TraB/GumN family protein [Myxococcales bacterium]|nr:TraB/GumN family protein [Myxococcales bacterium]HIN86902.1 TraB/GumN family protein [Myxococcales bacterium]